MKSEDIETNKENLKIARATKSIVTEITNIPFQPIDFSNDGKGIRYEDDLIAYGWRQFLEKGAKVEDTEWLARFPSIFNLIWREISLCLAFSIISGILFISFCSSKISP